MIRLALMVGLGGFIGSASRFIVQQLFTKWFPGLSVSGTFVANILGCLLIGIFIEQAGRLEKEWLVFLTGGICGGFTTFSAFALENVNLVQAGNSDHALIYISLSIILGLGATYLGMMIGKHLI